MNGKRQGGTDDVKMGKNFVRTVHDLSARAGRRRSGDQAQRDPQGSNLRRFPIDLLEAGCGKGEAQHAQYPQLLQNGFRSSIELIGWAALLGDARARTQAFSDRVGISGKSYFSPD